MRSELHAVAGTAMLADAKAAALAAEVARVQRRLHASPLASPTKSGVAGFRLY